MAYAKPETIEANGPPDNGKRYNVDWVALRKEFVESDITVRDLSGKTGVPYSTLRARIWRDHWNDDRNQWRMANLGADHRHVFDKMSTKIKLAEFVVQDEKADKKLLDDTHSIAVQKLAMMMREAATANELNKLIKSMIDLRESDTLSNIERTQLTIDIPEEYSE